MRRVLGFTTLLIIFGFTSGSAMASNALYGASATDLPKVWEVPRTSGASGVSDSAHASGVSHVRDFVDHTGTPPVWLHPDPPETEDTWDFWMPAGTPQVWSHPDPPETEDTWDFWMPTGTPQVWLHPDPHPDPELWDFYDPSEPIELWDFDVPADIPHVW